VRREVDEILQSGDVQRICDAIIKNTNEVCRDLNSNRQTYIIERTKQFVDKLHSSSDLERCSAMLQSLIMIKMVSLMWQFCN